MHYRVLTLLEKSNDKSHVERPLIVIHPGQVAVGQKDILYHMYKYIISFRFLLVPQLPSSLNSIFQRRMRAQICRHDNFRTNGGYFFTTIFPLQHSLENDFYFCAFDCLQEMRIKVFKGML